MGGDEKFWLSLWSVMTLPALGLVFLFSQCTIKQDVLRTARMKDAADKGCTLVPMRGEAELLQCPK